MRSAFTPFLLSIITAFLSCSSEGDSRQSGSQQVHPRYAYMLDSSATVDTLGLTFYFPENAYAGITSVRPLKSDSNVLFVCVLRHLR